MSASSFRFQQFEVFHDRCAMKVGTDGVLLGAWVQPGSAKRVLDVGAGSGLIALILAQRSVAEIVGVEYDPAAALQASENVAASPWPEKIRIYERDFRDCTIGLFDLIVSNPPFFQKSLKSPGKVRNQARHDETLTYEELITGTSRMLSGDGRFAVILPFESSQPFEDLCWQNQLYLSRRCEVSSIEGQAPKRLLLEFSRQRVTTERSILAIESRTHNRTAAFSALTDGLYLPK
jgi:tRNA1Val (adenine37-N6)-methyltransferase